jgi:cyclophilin family peptidyl-prolyl cis-trans isomerase
VIRRLLVLLLGFLVTAAGVPAADRNPVVVVDTSLGSIKIELFADKAPATVKNFLDHVEARFYDGTVFHRVVPKVMIQGGGYEPGMKERKPRATVKNESSATLKNDRGTVALARTPRPDSGGAQFFINLRDNDFFNKSRDGVGYCVFGRVIEGMDVVDKIGEVETQDRGESDAVPTRDVLIRSVRRTDR